MLLREAQQEESALKETEALGKYMEVVKIQASNLTALCKCSELCSRIGNRQKEASKKADYFKAAKTYAEVALRVNPHSSEANFVMAFAMGRMSLISSGKEKIITVKEIKHYADNSIREDPRNYKAYHVLGKWNYEVSSLNYLERTMAKFLYGGLPNASLQNAIAFYEKSRGINPGFLLNYLELAKAYKKNNQKNIAIDLLRKMMTLPNHIFDDTRIKREGKQLLEQWN
jgi:tetratricopeptide (TPR) repeat protein